MAFCITANNYDKYLLANISARLYFMLLLLKQFSYSSCVTDVSSSIFSLVPLSLSSRGKTWNGTLFCEAQQTGEGSFGVWSSPGAELKMCGSSRWFGGFRAQQQGARFHQERRAAPIARLHHRPQQPHGAQPPGQPLFLQKGNQ